MRSPLMIAAAFAFLLVISHNSTAADKDVSNLVHVNIKEAKTAKAKVGDLVQFSVKFAIHPDSSVSDLEITMEGKGLSTIAVVRVPNLSPDGKPLLGTGNLSAFMKADQEGEVTVKITAKGKKDAQYEIKVTIAK